MIVVVIMLSIACSVVGQFSLKRGMNRVGRIQRNSRLDWRAGLWPILQGLSMYAVSMVLWLYTLSRVELSFAFPFLSLTYVGIIIVARFGLGETLDRHRIVGSLLIVAGVILVSLS